MRFPATTSPLKERGGPPKTRSSVSYRVLPILDFFLASKSKRKCSPDHLMVTVLNSVFPIFALISLGTILRRARFVDESFLTVSDRLIYYICFPALLFWKIGRPAAGAAVDWNLVAAVLTAVLIIFSLSLVVVWLVKMPAGEVGSFSQACYRFSTYVGMAVVMTDLGEQGVRQFGVLIGFVIPCLNVLAISSMIWFSPSGRGQKGAASLLVRSTITNPLIVACLAGLAYSELGMGFPVFVDNSLSLMSSLALPLALVSIGGSLTLTALGTHLFSSALAAGFKLILLPVVGYVMLRAFHVEGPGFKVAMIYFALPTSPNNYILSAILDSDLSLAASSIVLSTLLSMVALSVILILFGG